jgi:putative Mn2+ efflux pump MntP
MLREMNTAKTVFLTGVLTVILVPAGNLIGGQRGMMFARPELIVYGQGAPR